MKVQNHDDFVFGRVNDYLARQSGSIDKMRLHRCRHTVATLLVAEGRETPQIMQQLGITEEKTLQRYIDEPGHQKIITEHVGAISKGLLDMVNKEDRKVNDDSTTMKLILQAAENLTDSTSKALFIALAGGVQGM